MDRSKTVDKTLEAIASCTFGALQTHDGSKVLDQAVKIVNKLHSQNTPALDTALCENAAQFLNSLEQSNVGSRRGANQNGANREVEYEAFTHQVLLALLSHDLATTPTEPARKARTDLGSALARSSAVDQASRTRLASIFESWLKTERSKLLRDEINTAVEINNKAM